MNTSKTLPLIFGTLLVLLLIVGLAYRMGQQSAAPAPQASAPQTTVAPQATGAASPTAEASIATPPSASPSVSPSAPGSPSPLASATDAAASPASTGVTPATTTLASPSPSAPPAATPGKLDLAVDANGLSKSTVVLTTSQGVVKFKFYPQDAPTTVGRIAELVQQGFYNGLTFHRLVPGFVIQGGDPSGTGGGGSGKKLKAEFNSRKHIEGTVAMARAQDPDSADSQFYISLGTHPHLDKNYTVFGQVIEGMDVARKLKVGDKIVSAKLD